MALSTDELFEAALELPLEGRRELTARLLEALDENDRGEIERAWAEVAQQRLEDYRAGRIKGTPMAEVFAELRSRA